MLDTQVNKYQFFDKFNQWGLENLHGADPAVSQVQSPLRMIDGLRMIDQRRGLVPQSRPERTRSWSPHAYWTCNIIMIFRKVKQQEQPLEGVPASLLAGVQA